MQKKIRHSIPVLPVIFVLAVLAWPHTDALAEEEPGKVERVREQCREIIAEGLGSQDAAVRAEAVRAAGKFVGTEHRFDGRSAREVLEDALDDELEVAYAAARYLPDTEKGKAVLERYVEKLEARGDDLSRLERIRLLELKEELDYVKELALEADDIEVRTEAIRTLGTLGGADAIATVLETYHDDSEAVQVASRNALWKMGFRGEVVDIYDYADSRSERARYLCAVGIFTKAKEDTRTPYFSTELLSYSRSKALLRLLKEDSSNVRITAALAIGELTRKVNLIYPVYEHISRERDSAVKVACAGALLSHLNTKGAQLMVESGYDRLPQLGWDDLSFKLFSTARKIAEERGDGMLTIGHLIIAFGQSGDETVKSVLDSYGLSAEDVSFAGRIMVSGDIASNMKKTLLRFVKKNFDPRTMDARTVTTESGRSLVFREVRMVSRNITPLAKLAWEKQQEMGILERRGPELLWECIWETIQAAEEDEIKAGFKWLKGKRQISAGASQQ